MQIGAIKPRVIDRNKILSKCKDAVFNTRGILMTPLCACNRELLLLIVQKYLCNITGKTFTSLTKCHLRVIMDFMKVRAIIPCSNSKIYTQDAVTDIIARTFTAIEVIV